MWIQTPDGRLYNAGLAKILDVLPDPDGGYWWVAVRFEQGAPAYLLAVYPGEAEARAALVVIAEAIATGASLIVL